MDAVREICVNKLCTVMHSEALNSNGRLGISLIIKAWDAVLCD